jgi:predicted TIM-barrel fold metal-dependent hydrolase
MADYLCGFANPGFLVQPEILAKYEKAQGKEKEELDAKHKITSLYAELARHAQNLALHKRMMRELSRLLDCSPDPRDIVRARNRRSASYPEYIREIFADAKIDGLNVDDGYSELAVRLAIPSVDLDAFRKYVPSKVWRTTRVEPLFQKSLDGASSLSQMESDFMSSLENAVRGLGAVCFKSVVAYRSGLRVQKTDYEAAKRDFDRYKAAKTSEIVKGERALRNLRNYMLWNAIRKSMELDVPFLFHTGVGDQDIVLEDCNPARLWNMLTDEELRHAKIVLVHVGYPYVSEAAFLTAVLPNVFLDLSVLVPLAQVNPTRIAEVLELAPLTKVMYASDVHLPDMYWLSATIGKSMLSQALTQIVDTGALTEDEAYKAARLILTDNAKALYKL